MTGPILLVHDDLSTLASVRRILSRQGHEVILATSVADAVTAVLRRAPELMVLSPDVEEGKGAWVLSELARHDLAHGLKVVLLGGPIEGFDGPIVPLPLQGSVLLDCIRSCRAGESPESEAPSGLSPSHAASAAVARAQRLAERVRRKFSSRRVEEAPAAAATPEAPAEVAAGLVAPASLPPPAPSVPAGPAPLPAPELRPAEPPAPSDITTAPEAVDAPVTAPSNAVADEPVSAPVVLSHPEVSFPMARTPLTPWAQFGLAVAAQRATGAFSVRDRGGERVVWVEAGRILAAHSSWEEDALVHVAWRDGLIDSKQHRRLSSAPPSSPAELLSAMRRDGLLRDAESLSLQKRWVEEMAVLAFSFADEAECAFSPRRLSVQAVAAAPGKSLSACILEGAKRSLSSEAVLSGWNGLGAVPQLSISEGELEPFELPEAERALLASCEGETTLMDLLLASPLGQAEALLVLGAAEALELLEVVPGAEALPVHVEPVDVDRLQAKWAEIQASDYFSMLGLARTAAKSDVERAFAHLSAEFHPLKYASLRADRAVDTAEQLQAVLAEAAEALKDDRLRALYAKHLTD
jgi:hypothetical protein